MKVTLKVISKNATGLKALKPQMHDRIVEGKDPLKMMAAVLRVVEDSYGCNVDVYSCEAICLDTRAVIRA